MSIEVMTEVWKHADAKGTDLLVLLALADWSNDTAGLYAWPSVKTLAKKVRTTERNVQKIIARLEKRGLVKRDGLTQHGCNKYRVTVGVYASTPPE